MYVQQAGHCCEYVGVDCPLRVICLSVCLSLCVQLWDMTPVVS